jgi:hypothetical protein
MLASKVDIYKEGGLSMKRYIILFFCITYSATAMGQNWLTALLCCCLPTQRPQQSGIQIEAKLYNTNSKQLISSDSRFYYPDAVNYYVSAPDPIEMSRFHVENRITLDQPTITDSNTPATIKFNARFGQHVETGSVTIGIGSSTQVDFTSNGLYAIISASKATRDKQ